MGGIKTGALEKARYLCAAFELGAKATLQNRGNNEEEKGEVFIVLYYFYVGPPPDYQITIKVKQ